MLSRLPLLGLLVVEAVVVVDVAVRQAKERAGASPPTPPSRVPRRVVLASPRKAPVTAAPALISTAIAHTLLSPRVTRQPSAGCLRGGWHVRLHLLRAGHVHLHLFLAEHVRLHFPPVDVSGSGYN